MQGEPTSSQGTGKFLRRLPEIYLFCSLFSTLLLCILSPPFYIADENAHSYRAFQVAHGELVPRVVREKALGETDANLYRIAEDSITMQIATTTGFRAMLRQSPPNISFPGLIKFQELPWAYHQTLAVFRNTMVYPPTLYLLPAGAFRLGEARHWTVVRSEEFGRLLNALASCILGWLALRICHCGRQLLFGLLLLPTLINLQASLSQDALGFSIAALIFAILSQPLMERRDLKPMEAITMALLLTVSIGSRTPYLPLLVLCFLPALSMPLLDWRRFLAPLAICFAVVIVVGGWQILVRPVGTFTGVGADPTRQLAFLHAHPLASIWNIIRGTIEPAPRMALFGPIQFGRGSVPGSIPMYLACYVGAVLLALATPMPALNRLRPRVAVLTALFVIVAGISFAEYLIWTPIGATMVGLQFRYYMPLMPAAFLLLPVRAVARPEKQRWMVPLGIACFSTVALSVPFLAASRYYGMPLLKALHVAWG